MAKKRFSDFPMIEIFGTTFALLVVLFIIINILSETELQARLERTLEEGSYKISWDNNASGYIVIALPTKLLLVERSKTVPAQQLCAKNSEFVNYARYIYANKQKQIVFAIVEKGTHTMKLARDCMREIFPNKAISIAWIIANDELLKSVNINQLPGYIKTAIQ
jgi:uncharacterized SAM-binding protein YcdF (DUF218 family)